MRKLLITVSLLCILGGILGQTAQAQWPKPPSWWMNSSYMTCVRIRESGNGAASSNLYGMMAGWAEAGGRGSAWSASREEQHYRAYLLWRKYGCHQPWGRYDGCC